MPGVLMTLWIDVCIGAEVKAEFKVNMSEE